jgi:hypothetical protein
MKNKKTVRTFKESEKLILSQNWKHVCLTDLDGGVLVPNNPHKKPIEPKLREIEKRLETLTDGVYCVECRNSFGKKLKPENFYVGVGNYNETELAEHKPAPQTVVIKEAESNKDKNILSVEQALANIREIEALKSQVKELQALCANYKAEIAELNQELNESSQTGLADVANNIGGWLKDVFPQIVPILDKHFELREKEMSAKQVRFLLSNGYEVPGIKRINGQQNVIQNGNGNGQHKKEIPAPGSPDWLQFCSWVSSLPDKDFENFMQKMETERPEIFAELEKIVYED